MSSNLTPTQFLKLFEALDEGRQQELVDHAQELLEEQRADRRTDQRV